MALRSRVFGAGKLLLLLGALVATYLLFVVASMRIALKAREVQVPDFASRTAREATALAADLELAIKVDPTRRLSATVPAGSVIAQDPPAGTTTRPERSVRVWLSAGTHTGRVPPLTGQAERAARLRITQDGLQLGVVSEVRSDQFPPDIVVAQDPAPDTSSPHVALLVNRGEQATTYVMPDLIGVNGERAAAILRNRGIRVAVVGSIPYAGVAPGVVVRQNPQAGFQIAIGDPLSLEVSR